MRYLRLAVLALAVHVTSATASDLDILPVDKTVSARVMQLATAPEIIKITERFIAAVRSRPEWFVAHVEAHKGIKGALPYHANMGISQDEYRKMVESSKTLKMMQMGTVQLSAARQADGGLHLRTTPKMPGLDGIVIDADGQAATTRFARLANVSQVDNRNADGPTGRWTGTQWQHEARSDTHSLGVKLALGKRPDHGDGILYLDVRDIDVGKGKNDIFYEVLLFPVGQ